MLGKIEVKEMSRCHIPTVAHAVGFFVFFSPERWHHLSPSCGRQRGEQLLVLAEHKNISEAGVGQSGASSADAEQVVAQDHGPSRRHRGAHRQSLIYAGEERGTVVPCATARMDTEWGKKRPGSGSLLPSPAPVTFPTT